MPDCLAALFFSALALRRANIFFTWKKKTESMGGNNLPKSVHHVSAGLGFSFSTQANLVSSPILGTELLKPVEFPKTVESQEGVFCYVKKVTFWKAPEGGGWLPGEPST